MVQYVWKISKNFRTHRVNATILLILPAGCEYVNEHLFFFVLYKRGVSDIRRCIVCCSSRGESECLFQRDKLHTDFPDTTFCGRIEGGREISVIGSWT